MARPGSRKLRIACPLLALFAANLLSRRSCSKCRVDQAQENDRSSVDLLDGRGWAFGITRGSIGASSCHLASASLSLRSRRRNPQFQDKPSEKPLLPTTKRDRSAAYLVAMAVVAAGAAASQSGDPPAGSSGKWTDRLIQARPFLLVMLLVGQKCATDGLTWYTRSCLGMSYSGTNVALLSEVFKFPLLACAVAAFESPAKVVPMFRAAMTKAPFLMAAIGLAYAVQNLLYFICLDHISAAAYQVLSQSKLIFTAIFMYVMLGKRFSGRQLTALGLLIAGAVATQLAEVGSGAVKGLSSVSGGNALLGCSLTVLSALLSALPNVFYERLLKKTDKENSQWVSNIQLTFWIFIWVAIFKLLPVLQGGWGGLAAGQGTNSLGFVASVTAGLRDMTTGFNPMVWCIVFLKTLNCIIIPCCLKYADNIWYGYAKPASIVLTCTGTSLVTSNAPAPMMLAGISMVVASMFLYGG